MAAGDVTVSNDAASVSALRVTKLTGLTDNRGPLPSPVSPNLNVAAAGNTVQNLAKGDFLLVQRQDAPMDAGALMQVAVHNQFP